MSDSIAQRFAAAREAAAAAIRQGENGIVASRALSREVDVLVREAAGRRRSTLTWDVGCNDGRYSRVAAENADLVVAFDADHATVDATYRALRKEGREDILALVMSVTDPSPDLGWRGRERASLEPSASNSSE